MRPEFFPSHGPYRELENTVEGVIKNNKPTATGEKQETQHLFNLAQSFYKHIAQSMAYNPQVVTGVHFELGNFPQLSTASSKMTIPLVLVPLSCKVCVLSPNGPLDEGKQCQVRGRDIGSPVTVTVSPGAHEV